MTMSKKTIILNTGFHIPPNNISEYYLTDGITKIHGCEYCKIVCRDIDLKGEFCFVCWRKIYDLGYAKWDQKTGYWNLIKERRNG